MSEIKAKTTSVVSTKSSYGQMLKADFGRNKYIYLMLLPVVLYYIIFHYIPMLGVVIAFENYNPMKGVFGSQWVGFKNFIIFFNSYSCWRVIKNTLVLSLYLLIVGFPAPIILALMFNEVRQKTFKRLAQSVSYLPHFISIVVISGLIIQFTGENGLVNDIMEFLGMRREPLLLKPEYFRTIYVSTTIWQEVGWGSVIYLAALTSINAELYEAAVIDGAGKWKQLLNVTLPGILPTIVVMFILRMGQIMSIGFEKVLLLYSPSVYETADIISTYVYRVGLQEANYDLSTAVGLFNSVINFMLLAVTNYFSRKVNGNSLW